MEGSFLKSTAKQLNLSTFGQETSMVSVNEKFDYLMIKSTCRSSQETALGSTRRRWLHATEKGRHAGLRVIHSSSELQSILGLSEYSSAHQLAQWAWMCQKPTSLCSIPPRPQHGSSVKRYLEIEILFPRS